MDKLMDNLSGQFVGSAKDINLSTEYLIGLMEQVNIGLFFLNRQGIISGQFSASLPVILEEENIADRPFLEILDSRIPEKALRETKEYLDLMLDQEHDEKTIDELNPLKMIEVFSKNESGLWSNVKNLSIAFKRYNSDDEDIALVGLIRDHTAAVELGKKLEEFEKWSRKQMQWMISLLHIDIPLLKEFVAVIEFELGRIDLIIKSTQKGAEYTAIIPRLVRSAYQINSSAVILNLDFFTRETFLFKNEINELKNLAEPSGHDFVPIVMRLGNMHGMLKEIKDLMKHIKGLDHSLRTTRRFDGGLIIRLVENLINHLTESTGKKIILKYHNFDYLGIPFKYRQIVKEFIIALTRFVIEFGIESAEKRKSLNVNPFATIEIASELNNNTYTIRFRHDGNLMRIERILQQAVNENYKVPDSNSVNDESIHPGSEVLRLFLNPDVAMLENKGTSEGIEIMNDFEIVKKKLKIHGGRIKVTFTSESFCEYNITFPVIGQSEEPVQNNQ